MTAAPETDHEQGFYDAHHLGLIHLVYEHRQDEKAARDAAASPAAMLKAYLQERDEPVLTDDERGLRARLQERSGWEWDLRGMPLAALLALQERGLLQVNNTAFDATRKAAPTVDLDDAARFRRQVIASVALLVEKAE